jgi:hypothetical protein
MIYGRIIIYNGRNTHSSEQAAFTSEIVGSILATDNRLMRKERRQGELG